MTTALVAALAALAASLALTALTSAILFWQLKRAAKISDRDSSLTGEYADLRILFSATKVAVADKERAMNMLIADNDRLEFTIETLEKQRDALLKEAFKDPTPSSVAIAVRDALQRLRVGDSEEATEGEAMSDLPGS